MKKLICILAVLSIIAANLVCAFAAPTTKSICDEFNSRYKSYNEMVTEKITATQTTEGIDVSFYAMGQQKIFKFYLSGTTLSGEFMGQNKEDAKMYGDMLIDSIEKLLGYNSHEYLMFMNTADLSGMTLEEDGIEILNTKDSISYKVNISKKASNVDINSIYGTVDDFAKYGDKIHNSQYAGAFGNVLICSNKESNGTYTIFVGQKNNIGNAAVQTARYFVEYISGADQALKFFADCKNLVADTSFTNFKIDYDVKASTLAEKEFPSDYKVTKIVYSGKIINYATPKPTQVPSVTATPYDIDATPTPTPIAPVVTPNPNVTFAPVEPAHTLLPGETEDPSMTEDPFATFDPNATNDPSETIDPSITDGPKQTEVSGETVMPGENTAEPYETQSADETKAPVETEKVSDDDNETKIGKTNIWVPILIGSIALIAVAIAVVVVILLKRK